MKAYITHLDEAHKSSGGTGSVELGQLVSQFNTPAWAPLKNSQSKLVKFLVTNFPAGDGIEYESLVILGLLHCQDAKQPLEKADTLYELLQEGGVAQQEFIAACDKDWIKVSKKMFNMVTVYAAIGAEMPELYSSEQRQSFDKEIYSQVLGVDDEEGSLLDDIFGVQSKVKYEVFKEKCIKDAKWVFNATELRKRIHDLAKLPLNHTTQ